MRRPQGFEGPPAGKKPATTRPAQPTGTPGRGPGSRPGSPSTEPITLPAADAAGPSIAPVTRLPFGLSRPRGTPASAAQGA
ncbi:hypothetical protein E3T55_08080, partial [Cryobacterium frigoriphilum]